MILQRIQFPRTDICADEPMFFNASLQAIVKNEHNDQSVAFQRGSTIDANTYFNSFSVGKWLKYTRVDNLSLCIDFKGSFWVDLYSLIINKGKPIYRMVGSAQIDSGERSTATVPFDELPQDGLLGFRLTALTDDTEYYGGYYATDELFAPHNISLALCVCTFRREMDITKNAAILTEDIFRNAESPACGRTELFISDNGKTLDSSIENEAVHLFPNKNAGGAGGFTRAMLEVLSSSKDFTHILLMDDDILINPDAIERTYIFLQCLKSEYLDAYIGGHMLKKEQQNIQQEAADCWDLVKHHPVKYLFNLEKDKDVAENEIEDTINYFSWWYCCMPISVISEDNLPLPLFIKRDDIEFGLRTGKTFITLNGINVWHESFDGKESAHLQYYYFRNLCIMDSIHKPSFSKKTLRNELEAVVLKRFLWRYEYKKAELALLGVQHFLRGIDWFKKLEPEGLNAALLKLNYKKEPLESFNWTFQYRNFTSNICPKRMGFFERFYNEYVHGATFNGWLLPSKDRVIAPVSVSDVQLFYRANHVLNYDDTNKVAYITQKDWGCFLEILKMYHETLRLIDEKFDEVHDEFKERYRELTTIDFWQEYLSRESVEFELESRLTELNRPQSTAKQRNELIKSYLSQAAEQVNVFNSISQNIVVFSAPNRRGITCNPKYILEGLYRECGDSLEYYWVSDYPETCDFGVLPVTVVKTNSDEHHRITAQAKVYITNDFFPSWAAHRDGQTWINTWHGGINFKHIGYDYIVTKSLFAEKIFELENREADYYLSASDAFTKDFSESFHVSASKFLPFGYPRNDILLRHNDELEKTIRKQLKVGNGTKLVLFAPTFRKGSKVQTFGMDFERLRRSLADRFGGEWVILFRNHGFVKGRKSERGVIDVSDYADMNELLLVADVLISDYSSCMYDFSLQRKPCFVFATDMDTYVNSDRGFATPPEVWPYPISTDNDSLSQAIVDFGQEAYLTKLDEFYKVAGAHDNGHATERAVNLVLSCLKQ